MVAVSRISSGIIILSEQLRIGWYKERYLDLDTKSPYIQDHTHIFSLVSRLFVMDNSSSSFV